MALAEIYYMRNGINKGTGAYIAIENNTKIPSIVSSAISVMTGTETNIGLQTRRLLRLPTPYKITVQANILIRAYLVKLDLNLHILPKLVRGYATH